MLFVCPCVTASRSLFAVFLEYSSFFLFFVCFGTAAFRRELFCNQLIYTPDVKGKHGHRAKCLVRHAGIKYESI